MQFSKFGIFLKAHSRKWVIAIIVIVLSFFAGVTYHTRNDPFSALRGEYVWSADEVGKIAAFARVVREAKENSAMANTPTVVRGTIVERSNGGVTVALAQSGAASASGTRLVHTPKETLIGVSIFGDEKDLAAGSSVTIIGTENSDGSITASAIQVVSRTQKQE